MTSIFGKRHLPRAYRRTVIAVPIFLVAYVFIVSTQHWLHKQGEIFPFFNWSLFSKPYRISNRIAVRVLAVDEPNARAAPYLNQLVSDPDQLWFLGSIAFQKTGMRLMHEHNNKDHIAMRKTKPMIENFVAPLGITDFELVSLHYDPVAYYLDRKILETKTIARFDTSETDFRHDD